MKGGLASRNPSFERFLLLEVECCIRSIKNRDNVGYSGFGMQLVVRETTIQLFGLT